MFPDRLFPGMKQRTESIIVCSIGIAAIAVGLFFQFVR